MSNWQVHGDEAKFKEKLYDFFIVEPINIFHSSYSAESTFPIRLSYHRNTHYNSLVDPDKPTIGVGLGLPGFKPRVSEIILLLYVESLNRLKPRVSACALHLLEVILFEQI